MASSYSDPAVIAEFFRSTGLPMPSMPSASVVRRQARALSSDVFSLWNTLHSIVERREEAFRKRWTKRNKNARANILLRAWPDMPTRHRPDFWALSHPESSQLNQRYENSFKYPYINLEDLTKQRPLLLLLNARARNAPSTFAHADVNAWHVGRIKGVISPLFLNEYTMYLAGQDTSTTYGKLVSWDDDDRAFDLMNTQLQFQPGEGILALEAEKKILDFLIKCCQEIFPDVPFDELTSTAIPVQPEPPFLESQETPYVQLSVIAAEAPYRAPATFDFQALKTLVVARRAAAIDDIYDLREDPAYFLSSATAFGEHSEMRIPDTSGKLHPNVDDDSFWQRDLAVIPLNTYGAFLTWDQILCRITAVLDAMPEVKLDPQAPLPHKLQNAFLDLRDALKRCVAGVIHDLKGFVVGSSPIRPSYVREPNAYGTTIMHLKTRSPPAKGSMLHLMHLLWDDQQQFLFGLVNLVDELQRLIDDSKEERAKFTPLVTAKFSDLALMSQIIHEVNTFFPWSAGFEDQEIDFVSAQHKKEVPDFQLLHKMRDLKTPVAKLLMPFSQKLYYPSTKSRNEVNTRAMREAESNLDQYWKAIDENLGSSGTALHDMLKRHGVEMREINRTPEWSEKEQKDDKAADSGELVASVKDVHITASTLDEYPRRLVFQASKSKPKTRGDAPNCQKADSPTSTQAKSFSPEPSFLVSKRAYKVFKSLFYTPTARGQQPAGEVDWNDFLHAMTSAGCSIQKLRGSAWQFVPKDKDSFVWHGIQFHQPHPSNKIPFNMARAVGRRLTRNYGWSEKTFMQASTEDTRDLRSDQGEPLGESLT